MYFYVLTSVKKKINIAKMRTNPHELHIETWREKITKMPYDERNFHLYHTKKIKNEDHFLIEYPKYTHIRV